MKHVLLPTDLSVQSLWPVNEIIRAYPDDQLVIHLVHMIEMPNSIHDLLFLGRNRNQPALPTAFNDALCVLNNKYWRSSVSIRFDFLYGSSYKILKNFMEGKEIEQVYLLDNYKYAFTAENAVNFVPFIEKIKAPVTYITFKNNIFSEFQILSIFLNHSDTEVNHPALPMNMAS